MKKWIKSKKSQAQAEQRRTQAALTILAENLDRLAAGNPRIEKILLPAEDLPETTSALLCRADRAEQALAEVIRRLREDVTSVEEGTKKGDFSSEIRPENYEGAFTSIIESLNRTMTGILTPVRELTHMMCDMTEGRTAEIKADAYPGEFASLYDSVTTVIKSVQSDREQIATVIRQLREKTTGMDKIAQEAAQTVGNGHKETSDAAAAFESISAGMTESTATLNSSSSNITSIASSVEEMSGTIHNLAAASEEMSTGIQEVSRLISDIHENVQDVSKSAVHVSSKVNDTVHSIQEISQSLDDVGNQCKKSLDIAGAAGKAAKQTNAIIGKLNESSQQIGKVVNLISDIASQTNILALNAAIEAASAGDAGRGFAVVANEVKELAKQTANATGDIHQQIDTMQSNMASAVKAVSDITEVINSVIGISDSINTAVIKQMAAAAQISNDATDASGNLSQTAERISKIAKETEDVAHTTAESAKGAEDVARSSTELSTAAEGAAQNTESASNAIAEINNTMSDMLKSILNASEQMHGTDTTLDESEAHFENIRKFTEEINNLSQQLDGITATAVTADD